MELNLQTTPLNRQRLKMMFLYTLHIEAISEQLFRGAFFIVAQARCLSAVLCHCRHRLAPG